MVAHAGGLGGGVAPDYPVMVGENVRAAHSGMAARPVVVPFGRFDMM
jgi:hypothetical protein